MQISESMRTVYTERSSLENVLFKAIDEKVTKHSRIACKVGFVALAILLSATVVGLAVVIPCAIIYRRLFKEHQTLQSIPVEIFSNKKDGAPNVFESLINSRNIPAVTTYLRRNDVACYGCRTNDLKFYSECDDSEKEMSRKEKIHAISCADALRSNDVDCYGCRTNDLKFYSECDDSEKEMSRKEKIHTISCADAALAVVKSYRNDDVDDEGARLYTWILSDIISRSDQKYVPKEYKTGDLINLLNEEKINQRDCFHALFHLYQQIPQYHWYDDHREDYGIGKDEYRYGNKLFSHMVRLFSHLQFDDVCKFFADGQGLLLRDSERLQMVLPFIQGLSVEKMLQILSLKDEKGKIFLDYSSLQDNTRSCLSIILPCLHKLTLQQFMEFLLLRECYLSDSFEDIQSLICNVIELLETKTNGVFNLKNIFPIELWSSKLAMEFSAVLDEDDLNIDAQDFEELNIFRYYLLKEIVIKQINEADPNWNVAVKLLIKQKMVLLLKVGSSQKIFLSDYLTDFLQEDVVKDKFTMMNFKGIDFDAIDLSDPQIDIDPAVFAYIENPTLDNYDDIDQKSRDYLQLKYVKS